MSTGAWLGVLLACTVAALVGGCAFGVIIGGADARRRARAHAGAHDDVTELARLKANADRIRAREQKSSP